MAQRRLGISVIDPAHISQQLIQVLNEEATQDSGSDYDESVSSKKMKRVDEIFAVPDEDEAEDDQEEEQKSLFPPDT